MFTKGYVKELWQVYLFDFFISFYFPKSIFLLFFLYNNGISLSLIGLCTSVIYFSNLIFEYPTGIFADKYGRKLSLQLSVLFMVLACLFYASGTFNFLLIASLLWGVAWSFSSGADQALVYDSLKSLKKQYLMKEVSGLLQSLGFLGLIISTYAGYLLFNINPRYPFFASAIVYFTAFLIISTFKEKRTKQTKKLEFLKTFKRGISLNLKNKILFYLLLFSLFLFFFEHAWHEADQFLLLESGVSKDLFSTYFAISSSIGFFGGFILPKIIHKLNTKKSIILVILMQTIGLLLISTGIKHFVVIFSYFLLISHMMWMIMQSHIIQDKIPSKIRATALSARQWMISIVFLFNPWLLSYLVQEYKWSVFIFGGIFVLVSCLILFWFSQSIFVDEKRS